MIQTRKSAGFTLVELMIATVVFSIVLLLITGAIIQIGRSYTKGMTTSRTQEASRRITDSVSQAIMFSAALPTEPNAYTKCIGNRQFSYVVGRQVRDNNANSWGLITQDNACNSGVPSTTNDVKPAGFEELLGDRMRLSNFDIQRQGTTDTYVVKVRVVSGDSDLLCIEPLPATPPANAGCNNPAAMSESDILGKNNLRCKNTKAGNEFCAMSELNTAVTRRI